MFIVCIFLEPQTRSNLASVIQGGIWVLVGAALQSVYLPDVLFEFGN